ncbi:MAG: DUF1146 domain-containing protein [Bacilli bacterium]|nr:DUF1146 domain-containing protein [Bacilli bacterium]
MTIKTILYLIFVPFTLLALDSINIKNVFKKNKEFQAKLLYIILTMCISYLAVNFLYDFFMFSRII